VAPSKLGSQLCLPDAAESVEDKYLAPLILSGTRLLREEALFELGDTGWSIGKVIRLGHALQGEYRSEGATV
jgi:hypothetical protein